MHPNYEKLQRKSYSNQVGGVTIPADELSGIVEITLGFQPLGISSSGNRIAIAGYFEPAICTAVVKLDENGLNFDVNWIRGVNHGVQSVRLFPDMLMWGEANRAQTVNFGPNGTLVISRNGDYGRKFFVLASPDSPKGKWTLINSFTLPVNSKEKMVVEAAKIFGNDILTIESPLDPEEGKEEEEKNWVRRRYTYSSKNNPFDFQYLGVTVDVEPYTYGIEYDGKAFYTVTDYRSNIRHGIYHYKTLLVPDIYGNGICFLQDGSALVTRYGQASPGCFNGEPGKLIYVPKHFLS